MEMARRRRASVSAPIGSADARVHELEDALRPRRHRRRVHRELEQLFRAGRVPLPTLDGFHRGRLVASTIVGPLDRVARALADLWLPWHGKTFASRSSAGRNVFSRAAQPFIRLAFREHELLAAGVRAEAFPFRTSLAPSILDPELQVLRLDYDSPENPPLIRRVVDELVAIEDGVYLGRAYVLLRGRPFAVAYFALER